MCALRVQLFLWIDYGIWILINLEPVHINQKKTFKTLGFNFIWFIFVFLEFASEEELVQYLIKTYSEMVTNGCENFYLSAQSLVLVPLHFLKDQKVENPQVENNI